MSDRRGGAVMNSETLVSQGWGQRTANILKSMGRLLSMSMGWAFHSCQGKLKVTRLKSVGSLCRRTIVGCDCRSSWWTSSFILEVRAEAAALAELDSSEIYWLTSLFKCSMLALDSHNLIACAEKNAMPFSGQLSCLCAGRFGESCLRVCFSAWHHWEYLILAVFP